jgi:hypothetical protein
MKQNGVGTAMLGALFDVHGAILLLLSFDCVGALMPESKSVVASSPI